MNNKAEALRNLSVPAFEVTNTPAADEAARRLWVWSCPEAVSCLLPAMVTSTGLVVPLRASGEISLYRFSEGFAETLGHILNPSCFGAGKVTQGLAWGTREEKTSRVWALQCFPVPTCEAPCHHPKQKPS